MEEFKDTGTLEAEFKCDCCEEWYEDEEMEDVGEYYICGACIEEIE